MFRPLGCHDPAPIFLLRANRRLRTMTKKKSGLLTALALSTALVAPAIVVPLVTAPPAVAGEALHDLSDLAAKVTPAVVNVQVTMKADSAEDEMSMSGSPQSEMEE